MATNTTRRTPTTKRQSAANRRNSSRSTGPKTTAGKDRIRWNRLAHGAFAQDLLLPGENQAAFLSHAQALRLRFLPSSSSSSSSPAAAPTTANPEEEYLVSRMILASWRLQRLAAMETRVIREYARLADVEQARQDAFHAFIGTSKADDDDDETAPPDRIAEAYITDSNGANFIVKNARYQSALELSFARALHELQRLRKSAIQANPPPPSPSSASSIEEEEEVKPN